MTPSAPAPAPRPSEREIAEDLAQTIADHAQFFCTRCQHYGEACTCETPPHDRARDNIATIIESALTEARRAAIEEAAHILAQRAAQYASRPDVIFNGKIMHDELKINERRIRALASPSPGKGGGG